MMYVSANEKAVSLNLHRYATGALDDKDDDVRGAAAEVGRCTLTPPDPQLKGAWYLGGFNP
jgi:hypothetical protein